MAKHKECKCIENAVKAMALATEMRDSSFFYIQIGHEILLRELNYGDAKIKTPKMAKGFREIIDKDANLLDKELKEMENNCKFDNDEYYLDAKKGLAETIKSQGRNLSAAYISGTKIGYVLEDAVSRKKLISCND